LTQNNLPIIVSKLKNGDSSKVTDRLHGTCSATQPIKHKKGGRLNSGTIG